MHRPPHPYSPLSNKLNSGLIDVESLEEELSLFIAQLCPDTYTITREFLPTGSFRYTPDRVGLAQYAACPIASLTLSEKQRVPRSLRTRNTTRVDAQSRAGPLIPAPMPNAVR